MKKIFLATAFAFFVGCTTDAGDSFDADKVCPAEGINAYGMPNRGTFVDERDGQEYKYTTIGDQVWMAQNLNYKTEYGYCYDHNENNCEIFGRLYSLTENEYQSKQIDYNKVDSVCPVGWHLPTLEEFDKMINEVGALDDEITASRLKKSSLWNKDESGTDECGFSAVPAGRFYGTARELLWWEKEIYKSAQYGELHECVYFYTETMNSIYNIQTIGICNIVWLAHSLNGMSIRCIKD